MRRTDTGLSLSATDLANYLSCHHRTGLDLSVEERARTTPPTYEDPLIDILIERGKAHEAAYVQRISVGKSVADLTTMPSTTGATRAAAVAATVAAMRSGADVIVQAALGNATWFGRPDVLRRVDEPSNLGAWSYEVIDAKLSLETRARTIMQLALYCDLLADVQGVAPRIFRVVTPDGELPPFSVDDYAAYFRLVRRRFGDALATGYQRIETANYPEPVELCDVCLWAPDCSTTRHEDDHLSLVAGATRNQRRELAAQSISTMTALGDLPVPIRFKPRRGSKESYERLIRQAALQVVSRGVMPPRYELRPVQEGQGLARLPVPSPGDLFLDLEGDPMVESDAPDEPRGREYLFGVVTSGTDATPRYRGFWALDAHEERRAFEQVMDLIAEQWRAHPGMHVYHYAAYEPSAFKRLAGKYVTREQELDALLRSGRFVDLYAVVRHAIIAGVESYSIKRLEPLYGFARQVKLSDATEHLVKMQQALWTNRLDQATQPVRDTVQGYNEDDCVSTLRLHDWLESVRADALRVGMAVPRPPDEPVAVPEKVSQRELRARALRERLIAGLPDERAQRTREQEARWILAHLLDWHRREDRSKWWEYFKLLGMPDEKLADEPHAIVDLDYAASVHVKRYKSGKPTGTVTDRYRYPEQEVDFDPGDKLKLKLATDNDWGVVVAVDAAAHTIDVRKGPKHADTHPDSTFVFNFVPSESMEESLNRLGERVAAGAWDDGSPPDAAHDLLLGGIPRLKSGAFRPSEGETPAAFARRIVLDLDRTTLAVQGPPGSGKTYTGAAMICALATSGRRVGVVANSHKVIANLLTAVVEEAQRISRAVSVLRYESRDDDQPSAPADVVPVTSDRKSAQEQLRSGAVQVLGGTVFLWSREDMANAVDVLFVDEAGQLSLANSVAVAPACNSLVLLGDPQQLKQPSTGHHPDGAGVSALEHVLGTNSTIGPDRGIFLPTTWRLAPKICEFTSELYYDRKLAPRDGLERQTITGAGDVHGAGLFVIDCVHDGNRNASPEEVDAVVDLVTQLTAADSRWTDSAGKSRPLTPADVLVVAPYNAQVNKLAERLRPMGVAVGTVDKFQGQERAVAIYSMATSRPEDAPRGMEFLFNPNRLNVATSRARCAAIVVASSRLFEPDCRTPRQMKLANGLCRFRELATVLSS